MRIRTQLILASFVLAVLPLTAIVLYSHHSSKKALELAYRREADRATQQMDRRLASIRADLDRRIRFVSALPIENPQSGDMGTGMAAALGGVAQIVEGLEFKPLPVAADPVERRAPRSSNPSGDPAPAAAPPPPPPSAPLIIDFPDVPEMSQYGPSEKQRELIEEIGRLGAELAKQELSQEEREDLREELQAAQEDLNEIVKADSRRFRAQAAEARRAERLRQRDQQRQERGVPVTAGTPKTPAVEGSPVVAPAAAVAPMVTVRMPEAADLARIAAAEKRATLILGKKYKAPVRQEGEVVGQVTPRINPDQVIRRVLGSGEDGIEIPFAADKEGTLYTRKAEDRATLDSTGIAQRIRSNASLKGIPGWIVSATTDEESGLRIGVARPVGDNLDELRRTAGRNFFLGLGLIAFAMIGIIPLSNHLTRDVKVVIEGADRIAQGDLMTRVPEKTKNELGMLARAFNRMAEDLSLQQQQLVVQERVRKEQELQQRLLEVEYDRKTVELEDARRFQLSMLPKEVPQHERFDIAVFTRTATEVGGDYYDFHAHPDGALAVTIGDATGHGAKAGTMVTVIKTLFAGYDGSTSPAGFLDDAAEKIKRMELGRMSMALSLARLDAHHLTLASAGMPPALVHRAKSDRIDEIALGATPLGTLGVEYPETTVELESGDTVLFLSDGFPELINDAGQQLGYAAALDAFAVAAREPDAAGVIASLADAARRWHGDAPPNDDVTFVVARVV